MNNIQTKDVRKLLLTFVEGMSAIPSTNSHRNAVAQLASVLEALSEPYFEWSEMTDDQHAVINGNPDLNQILGHRTPESLLNER